MKISTASKQIISRFKKIQSHLPPLTTLLKQGKLVIFMAIFYTALKTFTLEKKIKISCYPHPVSSFLPSSLIAFFIRFVFR
jgi:hypothetical protein